MRYLPQAPGCKLLSKQPLFEKVSSHKEMFQNMVLERGILRPVLDRSASYDSSVKQGIQQQIVMKINEVLCSGIHGFTGSDCPFRQFPINHVHHLNDSVTRRIHYITIVEIN